MAREVQIQTNRPGFKFVRIALMLVKKITGVPGETNSAALSVQLPDMYGFSLMVTPESASAFAHAILRELGDEEHGTVTTLRTGSGS